MGEETRTGMVIIEEGKYFLQIEDERLELEAGGVVIDGSGGLSLPHFHPFVAARRAMVNSSANRQSYDLVRPQNPVLFQIRQV